MQDRHDADRAICELAPVDVMMRVPAVEAVHAELGRHCAPSLIAARDTAEAPEKLSHIG